MKSQLRGLDIMAQLIGAFSRVKTTVISTGHTFYLSMTYLASISQDIAYLLIALSNCTAALLQEKQAR